jgi:hypothetical protein
MRVSLTLASFVRPNNTTAYASGDLVANNTTAGSVVPMTFPIAVGNGRSINISSWGIYKSGTTATNANFDLYLFDSTAIPTCTAGDNAAFLASNVLAINKGSEYAGKLTGGQMLGFGDGCKNVYLVTAPGLIFRNANGVLYGVLVAAAAYTPSANEVFAVQLNLKHE